MVDLGPHAAYIVFAYLGVAALLVLVAFGVVLDARRVRAKLAELEARGIRRRSAGDDSGAPAA